jgi:branched-chain amino acid transport system permease protein
MACLAIGLNIVVGYAGLLDLGYAAFFAIGAYSTALLATKLQWPVIATVPVGVALAIVSAVAIGFPTLRMRSDYLAIVTLGFGEIIQTTANNLSFTGGPTGIFGIPPVTLGGLQVTTTNGYYYLLLGLATLFAVVTVRLRRSAVGRAWLSMREDEDAAAAMGVPTQRYKLYAYAAGAVLGSITGSLYAPALTAIAPSSFGFSESLLILLAVALGGIGSIRGAIVGATVVVALPEALRGFAQARLLVFGILLVIMMLFRRQGLWPEQGTSGRRLVDRLLRRHIRRG